MNIKTCEQYVLAELKKANERIYELDCALEDAEREIAELRERCQPKQVDQIIAAAGRKSLFKACFINYVDTKNGNDRIPFKDWCLESTYTHLLPKGLSKFDFVERFEPEFREEYDEKLAEEE